MKITYAWGYNPISHQNPVGITNYLAKNPRRIYHLHLPLAPPMYAER
jgi:hypothetical protein